MAKAPHEPKKITLLEARISITLAPNGKNGTVECTNFDTCPCCGQPYCFFDCDESQAQDSPETTDDARSRLEFNRAVDGFTSLILSLACAGYDVTASRFQQAIQTTLDAIGNNLA
jgi:hypothetical protein